MSVATQAERGGYAAIGAAVHQPGADDSTPTDEPDQFYYSPPDDTHPAVTSRHPSPETLPDARVTSKFTRQQTGSLHSRRNCSAWAVARLSLSGLGG
jgi:hypothetical protein